MMCETNNAPAGSLNFQKFSQHYTRRTNPTGTSVLQEPQRQNTTLFKVKEPAYGNSLSSIPAKKDAFLT